MTNVVNFLARSSGCRDVGTSRMYSLRPAAWGDNPRFRVYRDRRRLYRDRGQIAEDKERMIGDMRRHERQCEECLVESLG